MFSMKKLFVMVASVVSFGLMGCSGDPSIINTDIDPETFAISGLADSAQFTIKTDVLDFSSDIASVRASVTGTDIAVDLAKTEDLSAGERWSATTNVTLWTGISTGTYDISITATGTDGDSVTKSDAAKVTITD